MAAISSVANLASTAAIEGINTASAGMNVMQTAENAALQQATTDASQAGAANSNTNSLAKAALDTSKSSV